MKHSTLALAILFGCFNLMGVEHNLRIEKMSLERKAKVYASDPKANQFSPWVKALLDSDKHALEVEKAHQQKRINRIKNDEELIKKTLENFLKARDLQDFLPQRTPISLKITFKHI